MIFEVMQSLFRISQSGLIVNFMWVPSHMGVDGNEVADNLAKLALKHAQIDIKVSMSKTEVKWLIANEIRKKLQKEWDSGRKGRHLFHIQEKVGRERRKYGNRKDDVLMSRMRIGHCLLNQCLHRMGKHETGKCDKCAKRGQAPKSQYSLFNATPMSVPSNAIATESPQVAQNIRAQILAGADVNLSLLLSLLPTTLTDR